MNLQKKLISVVLILAMLLSIFYTAKLVKEKEKQDIFDTTKTLHIWYADEALTDYLSSVAVKFNEEYGIRVIPVLQTGLEYLEKINAASLSSEATPDLFIASNDNMEKAYLAGLATEISNPDNVVSLQNFPESAIHAVTYQKKLMGYPLYFETSALLYNRTYFEDLAKEELRAGKTDQAARDGMDEAEETGEMAEVSTEEVLISDEELTAQARERVPSMIPTTFDELLEFAYNYNAPDNVEAVFKWDVSDIFFNYFFVGNYMDMGGISGDNTDSIDVYNMDAIKALQAYQDLGQYFAIEADEVAYETVIQDFMAGKVVMTTATTDVVKRLETAKAEGEFVYDYGMAKIPNLSEEMVTKSLSVTGTIFINGYSPLREEANTFAAYLVKEHTDELYSMSGKVTANRNTVHENENISVFMQEYEDSIPMPKMMSTSNFWVEMEIVFDRIWNGARVSDELKALSERLKSQISGEAYEDTYIEVEEETQGYYEYTDDGTVTDTGEEDMD